MKTIIAGSRTINDPRVLEAALKGSGFTVTELVCGMALGVDLLGYRWAWGKLPIKEFPALWGCHGKGAGFIRNQEMSDYADALIAIWDGVSRGTKDMIDRAQKKGLKTYVYRTDYQASGR